MVKIAIAGATSEVAQEVIEAFAVSEKHDLLLLSRKNALIQTIAPNSQWIQVDYTDKNQLVEVLRGCSTVLSFITPQTDTDNQAQRNLIDACVGAGVRRFAPSEWATSSLEYMEWYTGKAVIREYLETINKDRKVLEYTLFQPGLFTNYLTHPHRSANHLSTFETQIDFQNRRAIVPAGCEDVKITLTTAQDLANVVVQAVEYEGEWPVIGGISGCEMSISDLIHLAQEIRGGPFEVEMLKVDDLKAGIVQSSWLPKVEHAATPREQADALAGMFLAGMTLGISVGALHVSDEWNRLLPGYSFTQARSFLLKAWQSCTHIQ